MRIKTLVICIGFVLGLIMSSCGSSSKVCPAYSNADTADEVVEVNS